jgi:hypothetical protein
MTTQQRPSQREHRRETLRFIILPFAGGVVLLLAGLTLVLLLPQRAQVSIIADWMSTVLILCPLTLCLFPLTAGLWIAVAGMNRLHAAAAKPLYRAEDLSRTLVERTAQTATIVNQQTINTSTRLAFINRLLSVFDPPSDDAQKGREDVTTTPN